MTILEKRRVLYDYCDSTECPACKLADALDFCTIEISTASEDKLNDALSKIGYVDSSNKESVNHPQHYADGKIEVIDFIEDKKLGFCLGNVVKYVARAGKKDPEKEIEDLNKAKWYLERRIKELEEV